ncbi:hypothetical protein [Aliarcobacter cryaerophilus]|uniref:hypothetical protein n=1 Tax=Aliarcobacter cryaerophilus TaxID=28198 RepID=UPI000824BD08|nr:hypothetical protein [Aliarcobacter cryaerophilus]
MKSYKEILSDISIARNLSFTDLYLYEDDDDEDEESILYGMKLYYHMNNIKNIQKYLFNALRSICAEIDIKDVFYFLNTNNILNQNYSNLISDINKNITKIDYGNYRFLKDNEIYNKLEKNIEELYKEFEQFI